MLRSFFLISLLLYLSLFPSASPTPVVEIIEEELVAHTLDTVIDIILAPSKAFFTGFPDIMILTPQSNPRPELRPPALLAS